MCGPGRDFLEFAPDEGVENLAGWENQGDGRETTLGGFEAFQFGGTVKDGAKRIIAQKAVVR